MRYRTTQGRPFAPASAELLRVLTRVRQWKIAGHKIAAAEDLLVELDRVAGRYPRLSGRVECVRAALVESILSSIISIPTA